MPEETIIPAVPAEETVPATETAVPVTETPAEEVAAPEVPAQV